MTVLRLMVYACFSRALGFYQDILGMSVTFTNGKPVGQLLRPS